jgi:hypothetical protein
MRSGRRSFKEQGSEKAMTYQVWALIGRQNCRKGSTIRALSGIDREKEIQIMLCSQQQISIWVRVSSVNEPADAPKADDWISELEKTHGREIRRNMLFAFRMGRESHEAETYLKAMATRGYNLQSIVTLGEQTPPWAKALGAPFSDIRDVSVPTNEIARQVRTMWGWR